MVVLNTPVHQHSASVQDTPTGYILALVSAISYAVFVVYLKHWFAVASLQSESPISPSNTSNILNANQKSPQLSRPDVQPIDSFARNASQSSGEFVDVQTPDCQTEADRCSSPEGDDSDGRHWSPGRELNYEKTVDDNRETVSAGIEMTSLFG